MTSNSEYKSGRKRAELPRQEEVLLTPYEASVYFRVGPKTIKGYVDSGKLRSIRTPGGHRRIFLSSVLEALAQGDTRED